MAVITVSGPISNKGYKFRIAGDAPTVDEQRRIDALISQSEQAFQQEYAQAFGAPVDTGESEGLLNYLGEIPKGLARGAVGFGETAGLGLATLLPEDYELPTREFIRQQAYNFSPQADIGLEDSTVGTVSEGIGSIIPLYAASVLPGGQFIAGGAAIAAGAGEASERARAEGATQEQRNRAALFGAGVGALDLVPIFGSIKKRFGPNFSNRLADYITNIAMEGGEEAAQEATTQVLQNLIEQGYDPDQDLGAGTLASAGVGGLAGGIIAALFPGRGRPATPPPAAAPAAPTTPAATSPAAAPAATTPATPAPKVPNFVNTVPTEALPGAKPTVAAPKAAGPTPREAAIAGPDETTLGEALAEIESEYGLDPDATMAIHAAISAAPDRNAAIAASAATHDLTPDQIKQVFDAVEYEAQKARALAAPGPTVSVGQPTVRAKAPKAPKVGTKATEGTAPTASPKLKPKRYNALRAAGLTDEQINSMTPEQHQAVLTSPAASGVGAPPPPAAPEAKPITEKDVKGPEAPARSSKKYVASTEDAGDIPVQILRHPDGSATVFTEVTTQDYPAEFAASKSDEDLMAYEFEPVKYKSAAPEVETETKSTPAIWASKDFDIPVEILPEPAQTDPKTGEKYQKVRQQDGNIGFAPVSQLRSVRTAPKPQESATRTAADGSTIIALPLPDGTQAEVVMHDITSVVEKAAGVTRTPRAIAMREINGVKVPFYLSTGEGGKTDVPSGKWYPFFGLSRAGWFNKANGRTITEYYFTPELRAAAEALDASVGDIRGSTTTPTVTRDDDTALIEFINQDLNPAEPNTEAAKTNIVETIKRIKQGADAPEITLAPEPKSERSEGAPFTRPLTDAEFQTLSDADKARYEADPNMPPTRNMRGVPSEPPSLRRPAPPTLKLPEGADVIGAGQVIPSPVRVSQKPKATTKVEEEGKTPEQIAAERAAAEKEVGDNKAAQDKLNARWQAWVAANPDLVDIVLDNYTPAGKNAEGKTIGRDPTSSADKQAILDLLDRSLKQSAENRGAINAQRYFSKVPNPGEAMEMMAYDAVYSPTNKYRTPPDMEGTAEAKFLQGTGKAQAASAIEWVQTNLSPKSATFVAEETALNQLLLKAELENGKKKKDRVKSDRKYLYGRSTPEEIEALEELRKADLIAFEREVEERRKAEAVAVEEQKNKAEAQAKRGVTMPVPPWAKLLGLDGRIGLGLPLHPVAKQALARGDLKAALNTIAATSPNPRLARIAEKLATKVGNTKVQVVSGLTNYKGQPVRGAFDPKTNTIMLDAENGMDVHTVLHEMVHAATVQTLANKVHPLTKRLDKLYNDLKDVLVNTYGGSSLEEFVSEASSNPEFQAMLEQLQEKGSKVTAWSRFKNAVGNFLRGLVGMPPVQPNALATVDSLIDAILDPAPDTSNLGPLYMAANDPAEARKVLNATLRNGREPTKANLRDAGARIIEGGSGLNRMVMKGLMQITPLHLLVQQAEKYFPSAKALNDLVNAASADFSRSRDTLNEFTSGLHKYMRKLSPEKRELWNTVAHDATYFEVEPWLPEAEAKKRYGKGDDVMGKLKQYDRLKPMWESMDPEGKKQLLTAVNYFKKLRNDALESAEMTLAALFPGDKATKDIIWKSFNARLLAKGTVEPYLPLFREGDYVLTFNAFNPDTGTVEVYSHRFTSERERAAYREEVMPLIMESLQRDLTLSAEDAATRMDMRESVGRQNVNYSNVPPQSFVGQLMAKMAQKKVDPDVMRAVTELVIDTLPETAYAKSFKSRTGVFGATAHMDKAIIERASSLSRQQVQAKHRGAFSRIKNDLTKEYDENPVTRNSVGARDMLDQFHAIADFAANPTRSKSSRIAMNVGFLYTLGFNPSSALLNFFQLPGIVLPYLSGKYGMRSSMSAMREARIAMMSSGYTREVEVVTDKLGPDGKPIVERQRVRSAPSIINYDFNAANMDERTRRLKYLVEEGEVLGQFNRSQIYDILDMDGVDGLGSKLNAASGFMMHHSERMVREVTLASTYQLEVDRMAKEKGRPLTEAEFREAAREAIRVAEDTNGGIAAGATPRIAHTGLGAAIFMYKRFAVTMYGLLIKTTYQALKGQSPEARKIARYQLAGIFGMTGMLAGVAGMPLYGVLAAVFNLFRDDEEEDFQTLTRMYMGDGIYRGLVNHLTGINVATRIGLSDLLFRDNLVEKDQSALWTLVEQVGGPVVGTILNVERGISLWNEGEYWRGFENMVPAALRAPIRAFRFETQGAETMDGKPIVEDFSPVEIAAQALGFNPASYQNQLEDNAKKKKFERAVLERRKKLLDNYFYAYFNGDTDTMQDVIEDIYEFSQEYPELKIDGETLRDSQRQRTRSRQNAYHGLTLNDALRARVEAFGSVT